MKNKVALITGVTGMVGSHMLDYLLKNTNWNIHGVIRWRSNLENIEHHLDKVNKKKRIKLFYSDIRDALSVQDTFKQSKPDYVFHLAAQSYPLTSFKSPLDTMQTNIQGTNIVLDAIKNIAQKLLLIFVHLLRFLVK